MTELIVSEEEFAEVDVFEWQDKFVINLMNTGLGKTKKIVESIIVYVQQLKKKMVICMPNHMLIREFISRSTEVLKNIPYTHLIGKPQPNACNIPELRRIKTTCKDCGRKDCIYMQKIIEGHRRKLIFCVPQHLWMVEHIYDIDILIIDETIHGIMLSDIEMPPQLTISGANMEKFECKDCFLESKCDDKIKNKRKCGFFRLIVESFDFEIETTDDYYFRLNLDLSDDIYCKYSPYKKKWVVIGYKDLGFLNNIPTIVYNDATGDETLIIKMFHREYDLLIKDNKPSQAEVFLLLEQMTIHKTRRQLENFLFILRLFKIPLDDRTVIFTKMIFAPELEELLPEVMVDVDYYGRLARGTNIYEHCENIVLFGRFAIPREVANLFEFYGLTKNQIHKMSVAEEQQAVGRIRELLTPGKKIYLFTDTLQGVYKTNNLFSLRHIKGCRRILESAEELEGLTKYGIKSRLGMNTTTIMLALNLLSTLEWILPMDEWGATFHMI